MFFKLQRVVFTALVTLSFLCSMIPSAFAGKEKVANVLQEGQRTSAPKSRTSKKAVASTRKPLVPTQVHPNQPKNAPIYRAPIAAPHTAVDDDGDPDFDSAPVVKPKAAAPATKTKAAAPAVKAKSVADDSRSSDATTESRKRPLLSSEDEALDEAFLLPEAQLKMVIQTTDLVTGRLLDFSPVLSVRLDDEGSKAAHQAQIDEARKTLIATLLSHSDYQQKLLLDRFIKFTNGFDFLALDNPKAFILNSIKVLDIQQADPESIIRHSNALLLTGLYDHTNVSDPLLLFSSKNKENRSLIAQDLFPLLNVSTEVPAKNYEARLVVRMLNHISTSELQKIVQKLKDADLFVRPEVPFFELKFKNKGPQDNEAIFQIIFTHYKENMELYRGPNASEVKSFLNQISAEERARPRAADQSEHSSQQI